MCPPENEPVLAAALDPAKALEEFVRIWAVGMVALCDSVRQAAESAMPAIADLRRALQSLADAGLAGDDDQPVSELTAEETARGRWDDWRAMRMTDEEERRGNDE